MPGTHDDLTGKFHMLGSTLQNSMPFKGVKTCFQNVDVLETRLLAAQHSRCHICFRVHYVIFNLFFSFFLSAFLSQQTENFGNEKS